MHFCSATEHLSLNELAMVFRFVTESSRNGDLLVGLPGEGPGCFPTVYCHTFLAILISQFCQATVENSNLKGLQVWFAFFESV